MPDKIQSSRTRLAASAMLPALELRRASVLRQRVGLNQASVAIPTSCMYVSQESSGQTHARLCRVLAESQFVVYERPYAFVEVDASRFPDELLPEALAFVRDEDIWSALVPGTSLGQEQFLIFGFHFTPGLDNSGFVGWLASHLKSRLGTGVLVICGQNSKRGGIFDYWGAPLSVSSQVIAEVQRLRAHGNGG